MMGTPHTVQVLPNGFNISLADVLAKYSLGVEGLSVRVTGMLTATSSQWHRFGVLVDPRTLIRLWIDDHRLIDEWAYNPNAGPSPVTHSLLPNVSMTSRPVSIRVDMRPNSTFAALQLRWAVDPSETDQLIPASQLSPEVSSQQKKRRFLQERTARGWNQWARASNLAEVVLPHQVGVDLGIHDGLSGKTFRSGLLNPQFHNSPPVRMGNHAFDGSFSEIAFVPFPRGTKGVASTSALNVSVVTTTSKHEIPQVNPATSAAPMDETPVDYDNYVVITTNASTAAAAAAANLSLTIYPQAFFGAFAKVTTKAVAATEAGAGAGAVSIELDAGDLGVVSVTFSTAPSVLKPSGDPVPPAFVFPLTERPFVIALKFSPPTASTAFANTTHALALAQRGRAATQAAVSAMAQSTWTAASSKLFTKSDLYDASDALSTVIAWNVNFDPRVAVTVPVSRTFEVGYDFIFFDWDMYFLSLMAGTLPAAGNTIYVSI
jgi:hypothetical protein